MSRQKFEQPTLIVQVKMSLRPGEDDDLIEFFDQVPARLRVAAVKQALRSGGMSLKLDDLPSDAEVETALDGLLG
jgi:hypothetical protein